VSEQYVDSIMHGATIKVINVVTLFIKPELLLHDYFKVCYNKWWFILTAF